MCLACKGSELSSFLSMQDSQQARVGFVSPQPHKQRQLPLRLPAEMVAPVVGGEGAAILCGGHLRPS